MNELVNGLRRMRTGALMYVLATSVLLLGLLSLVLVSGFSSADPMNPALIFGVGIFLVIFVLCIILSIAGFIYFFMATGDLKKSKRRVWYRQKWNFSADSRISFAFCRIGIIGVRNEHKFINNRNHIICNHFRRSNCNLSWSNFLWSNADKNGRY